MKYVGCLILCIIFIAGCTDQKSSGSGAYLPKKAEIKGFKPVSEIEIYSNENLFEYMNGGADIYIEYQFEQLAVQQFAGKDGTITIELYKMGTPAQAFGIYTTNRVGKHPPSIGQEATYRVDFLSFWQDSYYVRIFSDSETLQTDMLTLGQKISQKLPQGGQPPDILSVLPPEIADLDSVNCIYGKIALNNAYFLSHKNVLSLETGVEAVTYTVDPKTETGQVIIVRYPDAKRAYTVFQELSQSKVIKNGKSQNMIYSGQSRRGFAGAKQENEYLVLAMDLENREVVLNILNRLSYKKG